MLPNFYSPSPQFELIIPLFSILNKRKNSNKKKVALKFNNEAQVNYQCLKVCSLWYPLPGGERVEVGVNMAFLWAMTEHSLHSTGPRTRKKAH